MEKFERDGTEFTVFKRDGVVYLCTGSPTGELKFNFIGDLADYYTVEGATSVVSSESKTVDELYQDWKKLTKFDRELGIEY